MKNDPHFTCSGSSLGSVSLEQIQTGQDFVGLYPSLGEPADAINAAISAWNGNYADATLSLGATVPFIGIAATTGKLSIKHGDEILDVTEGSVGA